jgi:HK97 family phage major capsid protein
MTGISNALAAGSKLTAATNHDTAAEIDATDLANLMAKLPQYAQRGAKWYMSQSMYAGVFLRLLLAAGGNTVRTLEQGALSSPQFAGFPVVLSPTLPTDLTADYTGLQMLLLRRHAAHRGVRRSPADQTLELNALDNHAVIKRVQGSVTDLTGSYDKLKGALLGLAARSARPTSRA